MINSAQQTPALRRLVLGSDAWSHIHAALTQRIAEVDAQQDSAAATDSPADAPLSHSSA